MMTLGEKLRSARQEAGLSQRQLCGEYMTRNMLSQIENGSARPSVDTLRYLAERLGKSVSYFLEEQAVTSPNQALMAAARKAYGAGDPALCRKELEAYREPDEVFDQERWLLESLACMALAEQMIAQGRMPYAAQLLDGAAQAGERTSYYTAGMERERLLLLGKTGQVPLSRIDNALANEDEALMLRAGEVEESANAAAQSAQAADLAREQAVSAAQSVQADAQSAQQSSVQAREAKEDAQALSEHTELYMTAAQTAAQSAETARTQAQESADEVDGVVTAAQTAATASEQSAGAAQNAAARAEGAAESAQSSQTGAATAAANAAESEVCAQVAEYNARVYAEGGNLRQVDGAGNVITLPETTVGARQYAQSIVVPTGDGAGTALLLTAPGGTVYRVTVSDSGALSAAVQS